LPGLLRTVLIDTQAYVEIGIQHLVDAVLDQLGALRVTELGTGQASKYLLGMGAVTQAKRLRMILSGMFGLAVRHDVMAVNPMRETKTTRTSRKETRAATTAEFTRIRTAVQAYANRKQSGPRHGAHRPLPAFVECLAATGVRPNEVLAIEWPDVDLLADPPSVTVTGTLIDPTARSPVSRCIGRTTVRATLPRTQLCCPVSASRR
jgi:integrase